MMQRINIMCLTQYIIVSTTAHELDRQIINANV